MEENKETKKPTVKKKATKKIDLKDCEKSFTVLNEKAGWYFVTNYSYKNEIVKKEKVGPTMRAIILDEFKIEAQRYIESIELN